MAYQDTKLEDGFYIQWSMVLEDAPHTGAPDENDEAFWPSRDPGAAGYVLPEHFDEQQAAAEQRMAAWRRGDWRYVGVIAEARCFVVRDHVGRHFTLRSPGLWGVESDAGDYLAEVYAEEKAELLATVKVMRAEPIQSESAE